MGLTGMLVGLGVGLARWRRDGTDDTTDDGGDQE